MTTLNMHRGLGVRNDTPKVVAVFLGLLLPNSQSSVEALPKGSASGTVLTISFQDHCKPIFY